MLIITNKEIVNSIITINDLKEGNLFLYGNYVYMKIEEITSIYGEHFNAVALDENCGIGECFYIDEDNTIIPLDGELIIKRRNL